MSEQMSAYDLEELRAKLAPENGKRYWRSLGELADDAEFRKFVESEFPEPAEMLDTPVTRRAFLKVMGASLALAGLNACTREPTEKIFPYVRQPEEIIPGKPLFYATAFELGGMATGVLAESHLGRPTKIEGNPEHASSLGATDVLAQASVLGLYDPDRSQVISNAGQIRPWDAFVDAMGETMREHLEDEGDGLRILTETVTSPTLIQQIRGVLARYPKARWTSYEPVNRDAARAGSRAAFDRIVDTRFDLSKADVIVSLDADLFGVETGSVRMTREFADGRRLADGDSHSATMNRLYVVESTQTLTGAKADHRRASTAADLPRVALRLAEKLGVEVSAESGGAEEDRWLDAVARDLRAHEGRAVVVPGRFQSPAVHATAHAINERLGAVGSAVVYTEPLEHSPAIQYEALAELVAEMEAGAVETLVILGGNPVYTAPRDLVFDRALAKVPNTVHLSLYKDETSSQCAWHVSQTHSLESWSDTRSEDGTATIVQPLIDSLYGSKSAHEILAVMAGEPGLTSHDAVRTHWKARHPEDFESFWRKSVHDGFVEDTAANTLGPRVQNRWVRKLPVAPEDEEGGFEIVIRPDSHLYDGRFANNGWLQELPRPLTRLAWDNAAIVSPKMAERIGVSGGDVVELEIRGRLVEAPVWIGPGQPDGTVAVHLGYGRRAAGRVADGVGFDAYQLRGTDALWNGRGLAVRKTTKTHVLATTQDHSSMEGRHPVREASLETYREHPDFQKAHDHIENPNEKSLFPDHPYEGYAWGMTIDLNACVGCNACTIACQSENNIAVVGKEEVVKGREMQWIRVDRYFEGDLDNPNVVHQPVPCMHCERAPCEVVCPVNATVHNDEGLNDMVYNRCVGTRYCSNNCPYKVRRFNFFLYTDWETETFRMQRNPDVTVRSRGVMEKCTYCVQRINHARIDAKKEDRDIRDGDFETACQQVCPAEAISFGDINDPDSRVSKLKGGPRNYALLGELGTKPRTTYLAAVRNPNPELVSADSGHDDPHGGSHS
jgi:molybdopterin-containing oxidoreductase family iron-sulfur binding subunit